MIPGRIGVAMRSIDGTPTGTLEPYPEICFRGAPYAAVYAFMVDSIGGWVADRESVDDWVTTSDLSVRMPTHRTADEIRAQASPLRTGRRIISSQVEITDETRSSIAHGYTAFARVPRRPGDGPRIRIDELDGRNQALAPPLLTEPLHRAAGIEVLDAATGATSTELTDALVNPMNALQGAMTALVAEMSSIAMLDHVGEREHIVTGVDVRYLAMGNVGPITTTAAPIGPIDGGQARVEVRDQGHENRLIAAVLVSATAVS